MKYLRLLILVAVLLAGCSNNAVTTAPQASGSGVAVPNNALRITLAYSPEKETWLTQRFDAFNRSGAKLNGRPIFVEGVNKSSGAARTEIKQGTFKPTVWSPSSNAWLEVLKQETSNNDVAVSNRPLVLTPVVISMWKPMAEALGWPNKQIGWSDLLALVNDPQGWAKYGHPEWGRFSWGHTDPEISTTALSTVLAEFYAASKKTDALTNADIDSLQNQLFLRQLGTAVKHYGYNTLVFSDNMKKYGMSYISAFPMEEITLIEFNKNAPDVPLVAIYPREGTFWHDNPFIVMASATNEERQAAQQVYDFLMTPDSQTAAMQFGFRPANSAVAVGAPITAQYGVDPNQPQTLLKVPSGDVLVAAKNAWAANRKRANIVLLVDVSGSMRGEKIDQARAGLELFLSRLLPEDNVALVQFSDEAQTLVPLGELSQNRDKLQGAIQNLDADGNTALYDGLLAAYDVLGEAKRDRNRINAIVLLSDGADTVRRSTLDTVKQRFGESDVAVFPVAYGADADKSALQNIADFARTIVVEGSTGEINKVFENLSRYF